MLRKFMISIGWCYVGLGILVVLLSLPLLLGRVKPNPWYGVRIPQAFISDQHWYAINKFGARQLIIYGFLLTALGLVSFALRETQTGFWFWFMVFTPIASLLPMLWILLRFANRLPPP